MLIGDIKKGKTEVVRVSVDEFMDDYYLDIRIYYKENEDDEGDWKPTKKGIKIKPENIDALLDHILNAQEELNTKA